MASQSLKVLNCRMGTPSSTEWDCRAGFIDATKESVSLLSVLFMEATERKPQRVINYDAVNKTPTMCLACEQDYHVS